jgi:outer membrane protein TolC
MGFNPAQIVITFSALLMLGQTLPSAAQSNVYPEPVATVQYPVVQYQAPEAVPPPAPGPRQFAAIPDPNLNLQNLQATAIPQAAPAATDRPLPINLATALYLSNARPLVIAFAQNSVEQAAAVLQRAKVTWLPNLNAGLQYYHHEGSDQDSSGSMISETKSYFAAGPGATFSFGLSDAIFLPLAARQELTAREFALQAARNDALAQVATAYFDVQEARGRLAGNLDAVAKAEDLEKQIKGLSEGLAGGIVPQIEKDRVLALLYDLRQEAAVSRGTWQTSSARLNRVLRLNPASVVVPLEPPHLQVTLIPAGRMVDELVPIGLLNRPELASQRALVQATLERLRQERMRPLLPSLVLQGGSGPDDAFTGGLFQGGPNGAPVTGGGRLDVAVGVVWSLDNLGAGNRAAIRERAAQQQEANLEFFNTEDRIAEEVVQADALMEAAAIQVGHTEAEVREANITLAGTRIGLRETRGAGGRLELINRPQEAVAALQQLNRAYDEYFTAVNSYNRAQFQLFRALGYPARQVICDCPVGPVQNVDTSRPPCMSPVCPINRPCP